MFMLYTLSYIIFTTYEHNHPLNRMLYTVRIMLIFILTLVLQFLIQIFKNAFILFYSLLQ